MKTIFMQLQAESDVVSLYGKLSAVAAVAAMPVKAL